MSSPRLDKKPPRLDKKLEIKQKASGWSRNLRLNRNPGCAGVSRLGKEPTGVVKKR